MEIFILAIVIGYGVLYYMTVGIDRITKTNLEFILNTNSGRHMAIYEELKSRLITEEDSIERISLLSNQFKNVATLINLNCKFKLIIILEVVLIVCLMIYNLSYLEMQIISVVMWFTTFLYIIIRYSKFKI